jgi:predicted alpha/beta-fold hydrolase
MERVGLIVLTTAMASMLLVGASLGAEWLQPYLWQAAQHGWVLALVAGVGPGIYLIAQRLRRKRVQP